MGVLDDIATVAQLSGLHAIMLIGLAARLLRIQQCKAECAKLEECMRKLRAMQQWPASTGRDMATQLQAMADGVLVEAADLVGSYRGSTFWCRVWTGRSMEARLQGMQDRINCLCVIMLCLCVHANLLTDLPASDANATNHHVISDPLHGAENCDSAVSDSQTSDSSTGQGGAHDQPDNTEPGGFESAV